MTNLTTDPFDWDNKTLEVREAEVQSWRVLMDMRRKTSALNAAYWWKVGTSAVALFMCFMIVILAISLEYATR